MKVSKSQAQANRAHIVETASALFKEHGYDGIGIADLMATAGFTQGGFYKNFASKAALMAEAATCGIGQSTARAIDLSPEEAIKRYLKREHRDQRATGCTLAALCSDAARKDDEVRAAFAAGIESQLAGLMDGASEAGDQQAQPARAEYLVIMAQLLGAIVLSRACPDDSPLADEILAACRHSLLGAVAPSQGNSVSDQTQP
ncbi:TetR/AcrR family transcriptional regulator [Pseudomonas sp. St316]|uniref:TetR/AcrR family transcriptional regulator n=1 Tax=Pseudomonas sp. St316 TaxID=2678257 RepID=UPI001BB3B3FC|nr:TetR/AcrR family transcriptional regulator [Pseudomonas sp. St316]BBP59371.1 TetR family transcriptional regulator [Pseudomonas sp. St316]